MYRSYNTLYKIKLFTNYFLFLEETDMQSKSHVYHTKAIISVLRLHYRKDLPQ